MRITARRKEKKPLQITLSEGSQEAKPGNCVKNSMFIGFVSSVSLASLYFPLSLSLPDA